MPIKNEIIRANEDLEISAENFAKKSLSSATRKAYESDWKSFDFWCHDHSVKALPAEDTTLCMYLSDLADRKYSVSTIVRKLTSIIAIHLAAGLQNPKTESVRKVLFGIKRTLGRPAEHARSLCWSEICQMILCTDQLMIGLRDSALLALGWTSALRRSELVALNIEDLEFVDQGLLVKILRSKTDQDGTGSVLAIPRSNETICPVERVEKWLKRRNTYNPEDPLFTSIGSRGKTAWYWPTKNRLPDRMVSTIVQKYAALAGLPLAGLSAHSMRRGLATEAAKRNVPERVIARHTRHKSISVLRQYIDEGSIWSENPLMSIYAPRSSLVPGVTQ